MNNFDFQETPLPENLKFVSVLSRSRYPILLVNDTTTSKNYVTKLYPHVQGDLSNGFLNETTLLDLSHPNIIHAVFSHRQLKFDCLPQVKDCSGLLMEYASKGDLCELLFNSKKHLSEQAVRTLFTQILNGVDYLHSQGIAHMDLKPDNILLDENFQPKIADFDQSINIEDGPPTSKGTNGYRAPEVVNQGYIDPILADIFSLGVILFVLKSKVPPYAEGKLFQGFDLYEELIKEDNNSFWQIHEEAQNNEIYFSDSFKDLIKKMLSPNPEERPSIDEIRGCEWLEGNNTLSNEELTNELSNLF